MVELLPETGRTHQIRVHLRSIGHPIIGDSIYNPSTETERDVGAKGEPTGITATLSQGGSGARIGVAAMVGATAAAKAARAAAVAVARGGVGGESKSDEAPETLEAVAAAAATARFSSSSSPSSSSSSAAIACNPWPHERAGRMLLHAAALEVQHPDSADALRVTAPRPPCFKAT